MGPAGPAQRDALRVLRPGGRFRFQPRTGQAAHAPDTYNGDLIPVERVKTVARESGCPILSITDPNTPHTIFEIAKPEVVSRRPHSPVGK